MAASRKFSLRSALFGALAASMLAILVAAIIVLGGLYPVGASTPHTRLVETIFDATRDRGVARAASGLVPPRLGEADIKVGGSHFKGMCQECHGAPGVKPEEFAAAMYPVPPDLAKETGDLSVGEVFWIAKNGIKMSGMPAFGKNEQDKELWEVAWFVKNMSKVGPSDYAALPNAHASEMKEGEMPAAHAHGD